MIKKADKRASGTALRCEQTLLSPEELNHFQQLLLDKLKEIIGDVHHIEEDALRMTRGESSGDLSSMPMHMADIGTDNFEQEFSLNLVDSERKTLKLIYEALARMAENKYGICLGTSTMIGKPRLEAMPWAKYCIEYARMVEKGTIEEGDTIDYDELVAMM
jgi:DnaK suppressor protein